MQGDWKHDNAPKITQVRLGKDYTIYAIFGNGQIRRYDCKDVISADDLKVLSDPLLFATAVCVQEDTAALVVPRDGDDAKTYHLSAENIYDTGDAVSVEELYNVRTLMEGYTGSGPGEIWGDVEPEGREIW